MGTLVFSHANGFPAGTYRLHFEAWQAAGWRVVGLPRIGHDPRLPATPNWPHLLHELKQFVNEQAPGERVHLVGHSLGGFLSLMLARNDPSRVAGVVLLDAPQIAGWRSLAARTSRVLGLFDRYSPAPVARGRRQAWPSREAAHAHYAAKPAFARWDPRVLQDYIECGTEPDPQPEAPLAVRLAFARDIEARIYSTLPLRMPASPQDEATRPAVHFIGGTASAELRLAGMAATRRLVGKRLHWIEGSHLFPMERPEETAATVLHCLGSA